MLIGYYLIVFREWKSESGRFMVLSCVASALLVVNAALNQAWPFLVVNSALILVTVFGIARKGWPGW